MVVVAKYLSKKKIWMCSFFEFSKIAVLATCSFCVACFTTCCSKRIFNIFDKNWKDLKKKCLNCLIFLWLCLDIYIYFLIYHSFPQLISSHPRYLKAGIIKGGVAVNFIKRYQVNFFCYSLFTLNQLKINIQLLPLNCCFFLLIPITQLFNKKALHKNFLLSLIIIHKKFDMVFCVLSHLLCNDQIIFQLEVF